MHAGIPGVPTWLAAAMLCGAVSGLEERSGGLDGAGEAFQGGVFL